MTGEQFLDDVRVILDDSIHGYSTDNPIYPDDEILLTASALRSEMVRMLIEKPKDPDWPARIVINRMLKFVPATSGTAVPEDFYRLVCGKDVTGTGYIPKEESREGEGLLDLITGESAAELVMVREGKFYGTASYAWYWAMPQGLIVKDNQSLADFPNAFYEALELITARDLLLKENRDAADRIKWLDTEFQDAFATLE